MSQKTAIVIPARMGSNRLPGKPLADIGGKPMIVHVVDKVRKTEIGPVYVACAETEIADAVEKAGGKAILTNPDHPSGTDRIFEAITLIDPDGLFDNIINVQGDLPFIESETIDQVYNTLQHSKCDMSTAAAIIRNNEDITNPNVVKAVISLYNAHAGKALYFSRSPVPYNAVCYYHHIGIYAFRREALKKYVSLPPSHLEETEKLEQLRMLENNMQIDVAIVRSVPISVDTADDLAKARDIAKESA